VLEYEANLTYYLTAVIAERDLMYVILTLNTHGILLLISKNCVHINPCIRLEKMALLLAPVIISKLEEFF
jgi:hypothetical protein